MERMAERPLVCPNCGRALLAVEAQLRAYQSEIQRLRRLVAANRPMRRPVAHRNGELFHLPTCKWAEHIPRIDRVKFTSREEALNAGYRPCDQCAS
jgi:hypothetical protein